MLFVALGFFGSSLLLIFSLALVAPAELAPLSVSDHELHRLADAGYFPLVAAASAESAGALALAASLQTFGCFALWPFVAVYFGRAGFLSTRARGWSNGPWIAGVIALSLIPSIFSGVTLPLFDYAIIASIAEGSGSSALPFPLEAIYGPGGLNSKMLPSVFLIERGLVGAAVSAVFAALAHDIGYRLREALEDFGFIAVDEARQRERAPRARPVGAGPRESAQAAGAQGGGFGQRGAPPTSAQQGPEARARAVLGVGAGATKREIERAYRSQMKRAHPDHGGSVERAAALNAARDALLRRG